MGNDGSHKFKRSNILFKDSIRFRPHGVPGSENSVTATVAQPLGSRELDDVPLCSILVKQDLDWTEERTKPSASLKPREAGDVV